MASRFPDPTSAGRPTPYRPSGGFAVEDTSGISRGVQNLASGISDLGNSAAAVADKFKRRENASDFAAAEALWTKGVIDIGNEYSQSNDFEGMRGQTEKKSERLKADAAALIRDPVAREEWLRSAEIKRLHLVDGANDRAYVLRQERDRTNVYAALEGNAKLMSDPTIDDGTRAVIRQQSQGMLDVAKEEGLLSAAEAYKYDRTFLQGADEQLAINRAELGILRNPHDVANGLAIPLTNGAASAAASAGALSPGGVLPISAEIARLAQPLTGDGALPSDPELAEAYLKDPEINAKYAEAAFTVLTNRFDGDVTAAVIALSPGGSVALAERWIKSGHSEDVLPASVRNHYRKVVGGMVSEVTAEPLPIVAADDVNLANVDPQTLGRFDQLQAVFGAQLPIISSARSTAHNKAVGGAEKSQHIHDNPDLGLTGRALDIDVSALSEPERIRLIETASALGFTGIGVYKNSLHLDTRPGTPSAWGPTYKFESLPRWAADAIGKHLKGSAEAVPGVRAVAPEYAALSFDQRLTLYNKAQAAVSQQSLDIRSTINLAAENAPAAIAATGGYSGTMPTVDDFVQAWGGAQGVERFKAFDAAVGTAETAFGMRTMSNEEIAATVEMAVPSSSGDMAAIEAQNFKTLSDAAEIILTQREKDPAGYVIQAFPSLRQAWDGATEDPAKMAAAIAKIAEAQEKLGMDIELLPAGIADGAASVFNNQEIPQPDRISAMTSLVFASNNEVHQRAIFDQLVEAGLPPHTYGAFDALERGDTGAAARLFRAAMVDPDKLPGEIDFSPTEISTRVQEKLLDENQVGDVVYGITDGTAENFATLERDTVLIERAVEMALRTGEASNLEQAIDQVSRDMYGDIRVVTGKSWGGGAGLKITLPAGEDEAPYRDGFNALMLSVGDALEAHLTPGIADAATSDSSAAILVRARDRYVNEAMSEGYFTNSGDGYVFIDPKTGAYVPTPDGSPLFFTQQQVLEAGMQARAVRNTAGQAADAPPPDTVMIGPDPARM